MQYVGVFDKFVQCGVQCVGWCDVLVCVLCYVWVNLMCEDLMFVVIVEVVFLLLNYFVYFVCKEIGSIFIDFVIECWIVFVQLLLVYISWCIVDIVCLVGFCDEGYFVWCFCVWVGVLLKVYCDVNVVLFVVDDMQVVVDVQFCFGKMQLCCIWVYVCWVLLYVCWLLCWLFVFLLNEVI